MTEAIEPWQPANEVDQALLNALGEDNRVEFFRIIATAPLYLPQLSQDQAEGQTFITGEFFGQTMLPVYTSLEGLAAAVVGVADAYTTTTYKELLERWPHPDWQLAVNPGFPIDAYLPIAAVESAARGELDVPTAGEVIIDGVAEDPDAVAAMDTDAMLYGAIARNDPRAYLDTLLDATVVVPTARPVEDPEQLVYEENPWRAAGTDEAPVVEVFTSAEAFLEAFPEAAEDTDRVPSVTMPFVLLLGVWPADFGLAINPRTELSIDLPADQVEMLLLWTPDAADDDVSLAGVELAPGSPSAADPAPGWPSGPSGWPSATGPSSGWPSPADPHPDRPGEATR